MKIEVKEEKYNECLKYIVDSIIQELKLDYNNSYIDFEVLYNEENVLKEIKENGFLYLSNSQMYLSFINPHNGNDYSYLVRADFEETFDRWSICLFQEYIKNDEDLKNVIEKLKEFYANKKKIIKKELSR